jgi:hypothetical protein
MIVNIIAAATIVANVGYAINPDAPKIDLQLRAHNIMIGAQAVARSKKEGYIYAGLYHNFHISERWRFTPMLAAGRYYESDRRKWWRFPERKGWDTRYMIGLEFTREIDGGRAGLFYNHVTNLKNDWSPRAFFHHMNDLGGAGATVGLTFQRGF